MAKSRKISELLEWYQREKPVFDSLARTAESILENLIKKAGIPTVSVSSRVKNSGSLVEKQRRKRYKNPKDEISDFVGLRVITYTEDDANKICDLVKTSFSVDQNRSIDKSHQLDVDQIGYRSYHFICGLGDRRVMLPEFEAFRDRYFEIQVRTVLQHAWAEVEHDRNYKFSGALPTPLQRRLYLISGMLEVGDRELNQLSRDIDAYVASIKERMLKGELDDEELSSTTLPAALPPLAKTLKKVKVDFEFDADTLAKVVGECRAFGLKSVTDLKSLFIPEFLQALEESGENTTAAGLTRDAMMYSDMSRYFATAWERNWEYSHSDTVRLLGKKYGVAEVAALFTKHGIELMDGDMPDLDDYYEPDP